ncbi:hypothetical protein LXL04_025279 [Taraxacum kok-saghyz]
MKKKNEPNIQIPSKSTDFVSLMLCIKQKARLQIWLFEQKDLMIEGRIIGFDEYMNLVLEDGEEVSIKKKTRKTLAQFP